MAGKSYTKGLQLLNCLLDLWHDDWRVAVDFNFRSPSDLSITVQMVVCQEFDLIQSWLVVLQPHNFILPSTTSKTKSLQNK